MDSSYLIDIAVLCQEYSTIDVTCDNCNVTILDEIPISKKNFLTIFYPHGENFGINKTIATDNKYKTFISFDRTINGQKFYLLEQIFKNLESDLNVSRNCFTTSSRIELSNEFANIKSLCDMNCCSVVASLPWSIVEDILQNYVTKEKITPIFVVSISFKTPTPNVKDNVIKFHYKIIS